MSDTISRRAAIDALHGYFDGMLETDTVCPSDIYGLFECIPSAQPEDAEKDIRAMCGECDAWNIYKNYPQNYSNSHCFPVVEGLPSAQPEIKTDGNTISRQAAIDSISADIMGGLNYESILKKLPSAERPTGEWIKDEFGITVCSECKRPRRDSRVDHINFCNSCGARMINTK